MSEQDIENGNQGDKASTNEKYNDHVKESERLGGIMTSVSSKVEYVLDHQTVKKGIYKVLDTVDENYMETIRAIWAKTPFEVKWAIINAGFLFQAFPHIKIIQLLVRSGLLEHEQGAVQNMAEVEKSVLKWTATVGPLIQPELIFLRPLVGPITAVLDMQERTFQDMRDHLKNKRDGQPQSASYVLNDVDGEDDDAGEYIPDRWSV